VCAAAANERVTITVYSTSWCL